MEAIDMRILNDLQRKAAKLIWQARDLEASIQTVRMAHSKPFGKYSLGYKDCESEATKIKVKLIK